MVTLEEIKKNIEFSNLDSKINPEFYLQEVNKTMKKIENIKNMIIEEEEMLIFPVKKESVLRKDEVQSNNNYEELLENSSNKKGNFIKVAEMLGGDIS